MTSREWNVAAVESALNQMSDKPHTALEIAETVVSHLERSGWLLFHAEDLRIEAHYLMVGHHPQAG
jgi:hypothetical protein